MAQRRMFSPRITSSGRFLAMPHESQSLYFHLCLSADDDGVVEAFPVMRLTGANQDNIQVLVAKDFVKILNNDLVSYIPDWLEHNQIRPDRKIDSIYRDLLLQVMPDVKLIRPKKRADTGKKKKQITGENYGRPLDSNSRPRLGKVRLGKININTTTNVVGASTDKRNPELQEIIDYSGELQFVLQGTAKMNRQCAHNCLKKYGLEKTKRLVSAAVQARGEQYAPTINDFCQLYKKAGDLVIFYKKQNQKGVLSV